MKTEHPSKSGAALIIALGFLAVLVIMIIAFAAQTRSERLAGRAYLANAQTRHLLHTALSRAMLDIDTTFSTNYPDQLAISSIGDSERPISGTVDFTIERDYLPLGNTEINTAFNAELANANWENVSANGTNIGRMAYVVINTSGLLDANSAGGMNATGKRTSRSAGLSPSEIQLDATLIPELNETGNRIEANGNTDTSADSNDTFVYNRNNAWRRFETLRDLTMLTDSTRGNLINGSIQSFSTFSHSLTNRRSRTFMGTNETSLADNFIYSELESINAADSDFVMNQLMDYLDEDTVPQDWNGSDDSYTDLSVEPVPLINELVLTCNFTFDPVIAKVDDGDGGEELQVISVTVSNSYAVELETWYPFVGFTNPDSFTAHISDEPIESGSVDPEVLGDITDWTGEWIIPAEENLPGQLPYNLTVFNDALETEVTSEQELVDLFESLQSDLEFPSIRITDSGGNKVDQVKGLELQMVTAVQNKLMPEIANLKTNLFNALNAQLVSNTFTVGMASFDPRLNWDGTDNDQWEDESGMGSSVDTLGKLNQSSLDSVASPDDKTMVYVRNTDTIDSPWEFTYFLYDTTKPWNTFQLLEANDSDNTRRILKNLSPFPNGPPAAGRVNPYSPHTSSIASVFMDMPTSEFMGEELNRLSAANAKKAAALLIGQDEWISDPSECTEDISSSDLQEITGSGNPWVQESYFRNARELFNPEDSLYSILLVAQSGTDADEDGEISDEEVRSTEQAVVYVWRDISTGKAAVVFYGLSETLRSTMNNQESWGDLLDKFKP